jgi:hypothetical protein
LANGPVFIFSLSVNFISKHDPTHEKFEVETGDTIEHHNVENGSNLTDKMLATRIQ